MTGYSRAQFGPAWTDTDRNGCDTRNDILRRDLSGPTTKPGTNGCVVLTGTLHDPYSGRTIRFLRGVTTSELVQIDHVVALGDAWQKGAARWPYAKRVAFANDPLDLLAVSGSLNEQKGDGDAAAWLPPDKAFRCAYVARQVSVKVEYALSVTAAEKAAMVRILAGCPSQRLLAGGNPTLSPVAPDSPEPRAKAASRSGSTYYPDCAAARAAGVTPIHRGDPGYRSGLDGDGDGLACE